MNYEFPIIRNISDVLPAVQGRDEFVVAEREGYTVINYKVMMADTFPDVVQPSNSASDFVESWYDATAEIRRECRGIIFDSKTGAILRRPFHKFFNVNERAETQDHVINLSRPHAVLEKLDGSMIAPFVVNGEMIWGTKMGATDVAVPVEQFVKKHPQYVKFAEDMIAAGLTPIFEWCSRKQRIVLDYEQDQLILTAIREMHTGRYLNRNGLVGNAVAYDIPVVRMFQPQVNMRDFIAHVADLQDLEGFVVRFDDGHQVKLKCHWYVQIHQAKEAILQDRNIVQLILDQHLDDIKAHLLEEDRKRLTDFEHDFNAAVQAVAANILAEIVDLSQKNMDRKSFAMIRAKQLDSFTRPIIFSLWDVDPIGMWEVEQKVRDTIRNNLSKTVRYEAIRAVWFPTVKHNQ